MRNRTLAEQETVVRWDAEERIAHLWTASPAVARKWTRIGYAPQVRDGGWWAKVPSKLITFRKAAAARADDAQQLGKVAVLAGSDDLKSEDHVSGHVAGANQRKAA
jgi:hypothetical protein